MKIKCIAIDMDGTLLNSQGFVSDTNMKTLRKAIDAGIRIVPATGRALMTIPEQIKSLPNVRYAITSNGGLVYDLETQEAVYKNLMPLEKAVEIAELLIPYDIIIEMYIGGKGYYDLAYRNRLDEYEIPKQFQDMFLHKKYPVENFIDTIRELNQGVEKINLPWLKDGMREKVLDILKGVTDISLTSSLARNVEVGSFTVNKGMGLKALSEILKIKPEEIMAIGDNHNDIQMLEFSGCPIIMGNAEKSLRETQGFVTKSNDENGVAYAIEQFCF